MFNNKNITKIINITCQGRIEAYYMMASSITIHFNDGYKITLRPSGHSANSRLLMVYGPNNPQGEMCRGFYEFRKDEGQIKSIDYQYINGTEDSMSILSITSTNNIIHKFDCGDVNLTKTTRWYKSKDLHIEGYFDEESLD